MNLSQETNPLRVLVVEDDAMLNTLYHDLLIAKGVEVVSCSSLLDAKIILDALTNEPFDAVILDNQLGDGEGIALLPDLQKQNQSAAVIMVSANNDSDFFLTAFAAGIHDYVVKPVNFDLLWLKINNAIKQAKLRVLAVRQHDELEFWLEQEHHQQVLAKHLFDSMFGDFNDSHPAVHTWSKSHSVFSGDIILGSRVVDGSWYFMLADAMGHGLAPAISLMPAIQSFRAMARKALPLANIVFELNGTLNNLLPDDRFVAAVLLRLSPWSSELEVWNGGMPDVICLSGSGKVVHVAKSENLALGVLPNAEINVVPNTVNLTNIESIVFYSDGLTETPLHNGCYLAKNEIPTLIKSQDAEPLKEIQALFNDVPMDDDISLCLINSGILLADKKLVVDHAENKLSSLSASFCLRGAAVSADIPNQVINFLRSQNLPAPFLQKVFTVITELYMNALEHGVLALDSTIKKQEDGFIHYYKMKELLLAELNENQFINLTIGWATEESKLTVEIHDSGEGFKEQAVGIMNDTRLYGRGLALIGKLSSHFEIITPGNHYRAVMQFTG